MIIAPFQGLFNGGFITRGCAPLYPGLSQFAPSGLRNRIHFPAYAKLTLKNVQNPKLQMEELQWGFPIATPLSLNKPHIN